MIRPLFAVYWLPTTTKPPSPWGFRGVAMGCMATHSLPAPDPLRQNQI